MLAVVFGFIFGLIGSMPMAGPIGALILGKSLDGRPRAALYIGLGGAIGEGLYAAFAFMGFSTLLAEYPFMVPASRAIAAAMVLGLGLNFLLRKRLPRGVSGEDLSSPWRSALAGFGVTAINPSLLATWGAAATAAISSGLIDPGLAYSIPFGAGAAAGIATWYVVLVWLLRRNLHRFEVTSLAKVVRGLGAVLVAVGVSLVFWTGASYIA